jgi:translation initiation factor IF-1
VDDPTLRPVLVTASPADAGEAMLALLSDEYGAVGEIEDDTWTITIRPIDGNRRGTIIYRVIQASRTVADAYPDAEFRVLLEDGNRWRLPPPPL